MMETYMKSTKCSRTLRKIFENSIIYETSFSTCRDTVICRFIMSRVLVIIDRVWIGE
jgi:hypothetical protein